LRHLRYTDAALDDLVDIAFQIAIESGSRSLAEAFIARIRSKCERIAILPGTLGKAHPEFRHDFRSTPYQAYIIFFRYDGNAVEIINVLAAARDINAHFMRN